MNFLFGLFRFLTWGNIISLGLLSLFIVLLGLLSAAAGNGGIALPILMMLMMLAPAIFHNIMCIRLQRRLQIVTKPMPLGFPTQMILISLLTFIYGILVINSVVQSQYTPPTPEQLDLLSKFRPDANKAELVTWSNQGKTLGSVLGGIHGAAIVINCVLSSFFLNKWKKDREDAENDKHSFDV